jgi:hypothetical protein
VLGLEEYGVAVFTLTVDRSVCSNNNDDLCYYSI